MKKYSDIEFKEKLKEKYGDKYSLLSEYINARSVVTIRCNDCGMVREKRADKILNRGKCKGCFIKRHTKTHDKFVKQVSDKCGDEYIVLGKYTYDRDKIKVRHNICGAEYKITASSLVQGGGCKFCQPTRLREKFAKTKEDFIKQVWDLVGGEYSFIGEYINANTKGLFRHNGFGHEFLMRPNGFILGHRCPACANQAKRCKDPENRKIIRNIRSRIIHILQGRRKSAPTMELVGCTRGELRTYLEGLFSEGMTWENYGVRDGWNVDHKKPCAAFNLSDYRQQKECFHYSNYQPLWAKDNMKKSSWFNGTHYKGETYGV